MSGQEELGDKNLEEGNKRLKGGKGFFSKWMGGGSDATEQACDFYVKAANNYKVAQKWEKAADAFCLSAKLIKCNSEHKHEAAANYVEAAICFLKVDEERAIECYMLAVEIYQDLGRFSIAAKHLMNAAELYESKLKDIEKALQLYNQAGDFYKGEESTSAANKCFLKVAHIAADLGNYERSIELFSEIGAKCADSALLKYGAKDHFFKAVLCALVLDHVRARQCVDKYANIHPAFKDSREFKLCNVLIKSVESENADEFTAHVAEFDRVSRMDPWLTSILLKIKKSLPPPTNSSIGGVGNGAYNGQSISGDHMGENGAGPAQNFDEDDLS